jgi:hypothetical protein
MGRGKIAVCLSVLLCDCDLWGQGDGIAAQVNLSDSSCKVLLLAYSKYSNLVAKQTGGRGGEGELSFAY